MRPPAGPDRSGTLENRLVPAVSVTMGRYGIINIVGTDAADIVTVSQIRTNRTAAIRVWLFA